MIFGHGGVRRSCEACRRTMPSVSADSLIYLLLTAAFRRGLTPQFPDRGRRRGNLYSGPVLKSREHLPRPELSLEPNLGGALGCHQALLSATSGHAEA